MSSIQRGSSGVVVLDSQVQQQWATAMAGTWAITRNWPRGLADPAFFNVATSAISNGWSVVPDFSTTPPRAQVTVPVGTDLNGEYTLFLTEAAGGSQRYGNGSFAVVESALYSNLLTNGGLDIWQRGAGPFSVSGVYTADRWQMSRSGYDTLQIDREPTVKKVNSLYAARATFSIANGAGNTVFYQELAVSDGWQALLGQILSLRMAVKLSAAVANAVRPYIATYDGLQWVTTDGAYHGTNTDFEDLDVTATIGANTQRVRLGLRFFAGSSLSVYMDNAMLVLGQTPVGYVADHPADELERCQRYYEVYPYTNSPYDMILRHYFAQITNMWTVKPFVVAKSVTPVATKNGTWYVQNTNQPGVGASPMSFSLASQTLGAGDALTYMDSSDDSLTFEANP